FAHRSKLRLQNDPDTPRAVRARLTRARRTRYGRTDLFRAALGRGEMNFSTHRNSMVGPPMEFQPGTGHTMTLRNGPKWSPMVGDRGLSDRRALQDLVGCGWMLWKH